MSGHYEANILLKIKGVPTTIKTVEHDEYKYCNTEGCKRMGHTVPPEEGKYCPTCGKELKVTKTKKTVRDSISYLVESGEATAQQQNIISLLTKSELKFICDHADKDDTLTMGLAGCGYDSDTGQRIDLAKMKTKEINFMQKNMKLMESIQRKLDRTKPITTRVILCCSYF